MSEITLKDKIKELESREKRILESIKQLETQDESKEYNRGFGDCMDIVVDIFEDW